MPSNIVVMVDNAQDCLDQLVELRNRASSAPSFAVEPGRAPASFRDLASDISKLDIRLNDLIAETELFLLNAVQLYKAQDEAAASGF